MAGSSTHRSSRERAVPPVRHAMDRRWRRAFGTAGRTAFSRPEAA
jgi:hypothetical protein